MNNYGTIRMIILRLPVVLLAVFLLHSMAFAGNPTGVVTGAGGDGRTYSASWEGTKTLTPLSYYQIGSQTFIHFALDGAPWPNSAWGVDKSSWSISSHCGGTLSGTGGDGKTYSASWEGAKTLTPLSYYQIGSQTFIHFALDGVLWPNSAWGVEQSSWALIYK